MDKVKKISIIIAGLVLILFAGFTVIYNTVYTNAEESPTTIKGQAIPKDKKVVAYYFSENRDFNYTQLNAVFDDNSVAKNIFIAKYHGDYSAPKFKVFGENVYIIFRGDRQLSNSKKLYLNKATKNLELHIGDATSVYYTGDIRSGELTESKTQSNQMNLLYNDLFENKKKEPILVEEKNTTRINSFSAFINSFKERWQASEGYVYKEKSENVPITGNSPLEIDGYYDKETDTYYYPALDGIYKSTKYKKETSTSKKLIDIDLNNHENAQIIKYKDEFIFIKESIPVTDENAQKDYSDRKVEIIRYDKSFKELSRKTVKGRVDTVTTGAEGMVIAYGEGPEADGTAHYNYIKYSNLKVTNLGTEKINYTTNDNTSYDLVRSHKLTFFAPTYVYNSAKKTFVKINTTTNKAMNSFKEK